MQILHNRDGGGTVYVILNSTQKGRAERPYLFSIAFFRSVWSLTAELSRAVYLGQLERLVTRNLYNYVSL